MPSAAVADSQRAAGVEVRLLRLPVRVQSVGKEGIAVREMEEVCSFMSRLTYAVLQYL